MLITVNRKNQTYQKRPFLGWPCLTLKLAMPPTKLIMPSTTLAMLSITLALPPTKLVVPSTILAYFPLNWPCLLLTWPCLPIHYITLYYIPIYYKQCVHTVALPAFIFYFNAYNTSPAIFTV